MSDSMQQLNFCLLFNDACCPLQIKLSLRGSARYHEAPPSNISLGSFGKLVFVLDPNCLVCGIGQFHKAWVHLGQEWGVVASQAEGEEGHQWGRHAPHPRLAQQAAGSGAPSCLQHGVHGKCWVHGSPFYCSTRQESCLKLWSRLISNDELRSSLTSLLEMWHWEGTWIFHFDLLCFLASVLIWFLYQSYHSAANI